MKTDANLVRIAGGARAIGRAVIWKVYSPEADERRFLACQLILICLVLFGWRVGIHPLGVYAIPAVLGIWWTAYLLIFGRRIRRRGELGRAIAGPTIFIGLLLGITLL